MKEIWPRILPIGCASVRGSRIASRNGYGEALFTLPGLSCVTTMIRLAMGLRKTNAGHSCSLSDSWPGIVAILSGDFHAICPDRPDRRVATPVKSLVAVKNLSLAEEYLADHFPGFPVMPGVLMLEALTQAGAWLVRDMEDFAHSVVHPEAGQDDQVRQLRRARPAAAAPGRARSRTASARAASRGWGRSTARRWSRAGSP